MPDCKDCGHKDYDHRESHILEKTGCLKCDCKDFVFQEPDGLDTVAKKIGYNNKWKFIRSLIWDAIAIILIIYLAMLTAEVTCVSGDIPLQIYNECADKINTHNPFNSTSLPA